MNPLFTVNKTRSADMLYKQSIKRLESYLNHALELASSIDRDLDIRRFRNLLDSLAYECHKVKNEAHSLIYTHKMLKLEEKQAPLSNAKKEDLKHFYHMNTISFSGEMDEEQRLLYLERVKECEQYNDPRDIF